jgi:hypothetical protein
MTGELQICDIENQARSSYDPSNKIQIVIELPNDWHRDSLLKVLFHEILETSMVLHQTKFTSDLPNNYQQYFIFDHAIMTLISDSTFMLYEELKAQLK